MRAAAVGLVLGALVVHSLAVLPAGTTIGAFGLVGAALAIGLALRPARPVVRTFGALAAAGAIAFAWTAWRADARLAAQLHPSWEGRDLVVEGVVASLPQAFERGVRFEFDVERVEPAAAELAGTILLAWYAGRSPEEWQRVAPVKAGERWRFTVRMKRPVGSANPHTFDYEVWLLERDVRAAGYVRARGTSERIAAHAGTPRAWIERTRERLRDRLRAALPDGPHAGVLIALAIGDQRAIEPADWTTFNRSGVGHLMSISGLHVTMIGALVGWLFALGYRCHPRWPIAWPTQKAAACAGLAAAFAYCVIAGFGIPAQRTLYMLAVAALALALDRFQSASRVLALAVALVVLVDPWAPMSAGFWLSFGAVAILFYAARSARDEGWLVAWARAQWAITLGLAPLTIALFGQVSLVAPIANAFAIPVVSLVVTPLAILAALIPIDAIAQLAHAIVGVLMIPLEWLATLPAALWRQHAPPWWALAAAALGIAWMLAPRGIPARYAGLPLVLPLLLVVPPRPAHGEAWLDVLDVGQGLAVVVRTRDHTLVYDAGPAYSTEADAGNRVVVPFLRGEGIARLDRFVVTHMDNDHAGGAASVAAVVTTDLMQASLPVDHPAMQAAAYRMPCRGGQRWRWDDVEFAMLHPTLDAADDPARRANARSCVLRIAAGERAVLLTGDIEAREEAALVAAGVALAADVLLAPHHGSRTSSTAPFLDAVAPRDAIVTAGYRNRFGHPRADVIARYVERGVAIHRTDTGGRVRVRLSDRAADVQSYRATHRRYWRNVVESP